MHIIHRHRPVLVTAIIEYGLPDFPSILQQFVWQETDFAPQYPELNRFLRFWEMNLDGKIRHVHVAAPNLGSSLRHADFVRILH